MTTTTLEDLKPAQIKPHAHNPRREVGDLAELAASIAEHGIIEPLIVAPTTFGNYVLIAGHRRLAAARQAKLKTVPCLIRADLTDPARQIEAMLVENLQRTDLTPVEEGQAYQQLLEFPGGGYTQARLVKATGRAAATIRGRLKLAALPKPTLSRIHAGQISLGEAQALVDFAGDKATYGKLEKAAGTDNFPRVLKTAKNQRQLAQMLARRRKQLTVAGVRIVADRGGRPAATIYLRGKKEIDEHRDCPGFAAAVNGTAYDWSKPTVDVVYFCDRPDLHELDATTAELQRVEQQEADRATKAALAVDAAARRAWIRDHVLGDPSEGLALDMLRQNAHRRVKDYNVRREVLAAVLGCDDTPKAVAARIDELGLLQLAVFLDIAAHSCDDQDLQSPGGWGVGTQTWSNRKRWRARLATLYGYTWTEHEQQMLDQAAADADPDEPGEDLDDEDAGDGWPPIVDVHLPDEELAEAAS